MKRTLGLMVLAFALGGCNAKLKRHVQGIDDLAVKVRHQQVRPEVDLSDLDSGVSEEVGGRPDLNHTSTGGAIDAFEQGFTMRLASLMDTQKMAKRIGKTTRGYFKNGQPFGLNPKSDWSMELMITEWGVGSGLSGAAQAEMRVFAGVFAPTGERIWHKSVGCTWDLAPNMRWEMGQVSANLVSLSAMRDDALRNAYMDLAAACGRALSNTFHQDVRRAKKKANKQ